MNSPSFIKRLAALENRYPASQKLSLDNLKVLLERLHNPQKRLPPVIHIAGTNGKGSTHAFLKAILMAAGYRVHAYTSPHLIHFTERIVLNGQQISEHDFLFYLDKALDVLGDKPITWFELVTAVAFDAFATQPADVVVLETGMGGRLDATNVIDQPACTIITSISPDHQQALGSTLSQIAQEKAGIIKKGVPVVTCQQPCDVYQVLAEIAAQRHCPLYYQSREWDSTLNQVLNTPSFNYCFNDEEQVYNLPALIGCHQLQNAGMALTALNVLKLLLPTEPSAIKTGLAQVKWPGRLQSLVHHKFHQLLPTTAKLYLDGAHNQGSIEALVHFIKDCYQQDNTWPIIIFGALLRKNLTELLSPLQNYAQHIIGVPIEGEQAYTSDMIASTALQLGFKASAAPSVTAAINLAAQQQPYPKTIIICGSLYLAGQVLASDPHFTTFN